MISRFLTPIVFLTLLVATDSLAQAQCGKAVAGRTSFFDCDQIAETQQSNFQIAMPLSLVHQLQPFGVPKLRIDSPEAESSTSFSNDDSPIKLELSHLFASRPKTLPYRRSEELEAAFRSRYGASYFESGEAGIDISATQLLEKTEEERSREVFKNLLRNHNFQFDGDMFGPDRTVLIATWKTNSVYLGKTILLAEQESLPLVQKPSDRTELVWSNGGFRLRRYARPRAPRCGFFEGEYLAASISLIVHSKNGSNIVLKPKTATGILTDYIVLSESGKAWSTMNPDAESPRPILSRGR